MANDWNLTEQLDQWRELARVVRDEGLSELTVESSGVRLTLKAETPVYVAPPVYAAPSLPAPGQAGPQPTVTPTVNAPGTGGETPSDAPTPASDLIPISSPMVGVFYRSQSPDDPAFVEVGDHIEIGQTVGLVEAMKTFNEITSEVAGMVVEARVGNSELVETGSTLFLIRP